MSATNSSRSDLSPQQLWDMALGQLRFQMTQATFDTWVKDTYLISQAGDTLVVGTPSTFAKDWLENRLITTIRRTVTNLVGQPVDIRFVFDAAGPVAESPDPDPSTTDDKVDVDKALEAELSPGQIVAQADYYKGFFEKGGAGFSQLVHHSTYYWMPLLGPAFFLWKVLDSEDTRSLKSINPNFWSPPKKYSYADLAGKLGKANGRYVGGDPLECHQSREARKAGHPLQGQAECCLSPQYDWLRLTPHPNGQGLICKHWHDGLLEILCQVGLAVVELKPRQRKSTIQVWRMPPLLTPQQYGRLNAQIQADYDGWLEQYGHLFNVPNRLAWERIEESILAPLMPCYDQAEVSHNFEQRPKKREFLQNGFENPHFAPYMTRNDLD
jgi:hypothetical protein